MSILSIMMMITALVAGFILARFGIYHLLAWLNPVKTMKLTYVDRSGIKHVRNMAIDGADARDLIDALNEIKRSKDTGQSAN